jgi:hypothetical protein
VRKAEKFSTAVRARFGRLVRKASLTSVWLMGSRRAALIFLFHLPSQPARAAVIRRRGCGAETP